MTRLLRSHTRTSLRTVGPLVFFLLARVAYSDSPNYDQNGRLQGWIFSGAAEIGLFGTSADGDYSGSPLVGMRATNLGLADGVDTVVSSASGDADVVSALIGANIEVVTPRLNLLPSGPRLFLDVSLFDVVTPETALSRTANPGPFSIPDNLPRFLAFTPELLVKGRGTEITSQHQGLQLHVGFGSAFTFDIDDEQIRIKPSIVYSQIQNKVSGIAKRAVRLLNQDATVDRLRVRTLTSFRLISLEDDSTEVYHGIGPALEIEYVTRNRLGPFRISLYVKGHGTRLFGDLTTNLEAANPDQPAEVVQWNYRNERWMYRATTGIRFHWLPERDW
ncbi:MAG: hypothetical protein VCB25_01380 [Myxococcota bacterium]